MRAAEDLVVRRHDVDLARGAHAQLNARTTEAVSLDQLLHDATLLVEEGEVLLDVDLLVLELYGGAQVGRGLVEIQERVTEPAHAEIEFDDRRSHSCASPAQLVGCR